MFDLKLDTRQIDKALKDVNKDVMAATRAGLTAAGRELAKMELPLVPVFKSNLGAGLTSLPKGVFGPLLTIKGLAGHEFRRVQRAGGKGMGRAIPGLARDSIKSSAPKETFRNNEYKVLIGPVGGRVNLYRRKIEKIYGFAQRIDEQSGPVVEAEFEKAYRKVLTRRRG